MPPLVALGIQTQQPDLGKTLETAQAIQAGQQMQQERALQIAMTRQQMQDFGTVQGALQQTGGDLDKAMPLIAGKVTLPTMQTLQQFQKNKVQIQTDLANLDEKKRASAANEADKLTSVIVNAQQMDPQAYTTNYPQIIQAAKDAAPSSPIVQKLDPSQPPIPQAQLGQIGMGLMLTKNTLDVVNAQRAAAQAPYDLQKKQADAAEAQAKADYYKKHGTVPGVPVDQQEMDDYLSKNPGKGPADFMAYKAKLVPQFNFSLQNSGTTGNAADVAKRFGYTPQSFDNLAENYWKTGELPKTGRGGPSLAANKAIMNRANELHPGESNVGNPEIQKAYAKSLDNLQKQFDQVTAFESTAEKNINRLLVTAQNIPDLGNRFSNIPVRMINEKMLGTENMARFKADLLTAQNEAAKVLNSSNASGVLSDSSRHELQELADGNLSYSALKGAFEEITGDMGRRKQSYLDQISDLQSKIRAPQNNPTKPQGGGKVIKYKIVNGQLVQDNG